MSSESRNNTSSILMILIVFGQICSLFQNIFPKVDYILCIGCLFIYFVLYRTIIKKALLFAVSIVGLLIMGLAFSYINGIENDSFFLVIAIGINTYVFFSIFANRRTMITCHELCMIYKELVLIGCISCIYNLVVNFKNIISLTGTGYAYGISFSSFYSGRNTFGFFLCIFFTASIFLLIKNKKKIYLLTTIFFLINIILTFSRSCILFACIYLFTIFILEAQYSVNKKIGIFMLVIIVFAITTMLYKQFYDIIDNYLIRKTYGDSYRTEYWNTAFSMIKMSPFFGFGPGCANSILTVLGSIAGSSFHNTYIEVIMWGGFLLGIVYLYIMYHIYQIIKRLKKYDIVTHNVFFSFFIAFLVYCIFETSMLFALGSRAQLLTIFILVMPSGYLKSIQNSELSVKQQQKATDTKDILLKSISYSKEIGY